MSDQKTRCTQMLSKECVDAEICYERIREDEVFEDCNSGELGTGTLL